MNPQASRSVLLLVADLHRRGFQRLRISPGLSPSGMHWRCLITPVTNTLAAHGALARDWSVGAVYSSGMGQAYFGWDDAENALPGQLAKLFLARFPKTAQAGYGPDWTYAGWYLDMLHRTYPDALPVAYSDSGQSQDFLSVLGGLRELQIPLPPGESP